MATDIKKMMEDYIKAWNSHDTDNVPSFYTDDCIYEDVGLGTVYHGKKELATFINSALVDLPDTKLELKTAFGTGDWAACEWVFSGTQAHSSIPGIPATGKTVSFREAAIIQLHNGKISRDSHYWNLATLLEQLGVMPAQPK